MNYQTVVDWDVNLRDVLFTDADTLPEALQGLVKGGVYITAGAPTVVAGKYIPGAIVQNAVTGDVYRNQGSTAVPNWATV